MVNRITFNAKAPVMPVIDSHIHLDFDLFDAKRDILMLHMQRLGLVHAVIPGVSAAHWAKQRAVAKQYDCSYALGIHPWYCDEQWPSDIVQLEQLLIKNKQDKRLVAIGECGLDGGYRDTWDMQIHCFEAQLSLAQRFDLPVIIHSVKAHNEVLHLLKRYPLNKAGVIHGFYGSTQLAQQYLDCGMKLGIGHLLLNKTAKKLRESIVNLPLASLVVETDLALALQQEKPDVDDNISESNLMLHLLIAEIAMLQKKSRVLVSEQVFRNTLQLFDL